MPRVLGGSDQRSCRRAEFLALGMQDKAAQLVFPIECRIERVVGLLPQRRRQQDASATATPTRPPPSLHRADDTHKPCCTGPRTPVPRVRPKVTSVPATFCTSIAQCSRMWPIQVPSSSRNLRKNPPSVAVRAAVIAQARQSGDQTFNEIRSDFCRGPVLQYSQINDVPYDRKACPGIRADKHIG